MQKQHLHIVLLVFGCCLAGGCGEAKFKHLNPYLHGEQELSFRLPDSVRTSALISGWEILPFASPGSSAGPLRILSPDGRLLKIDWTLAGTSDPILLSNRVRTVHGLTASNLQLGLTCDIVIADDGRSVSCAMSGETSTAVEAKFAVDIEGIKLRGLAAMEQTWTKSLRGMDILLPWGDRWQLHAQADITPLPLSTHEIAAKLAFTDPAIRQLTVNWSPLESTSGERGLDINTSRDSDDRALAMLIASIPPVSATLPTEAELLENAADLTLAQWLVHAEFSPNYLNDLAVSEDQVFLLTYGLEAYQTMYSWGTIRDDELLAKEPLLDAAMSRVDTMSREIERGGSLEMRFREATVWTFAENNLATDRPNARKIYRDQAVVAIDDAQNELKRRVKLWRKTVMNQRPDSVALYELFVGGDSTGTRDMDESFVAPDSLELLRIVGHADLDWFTEVNAKWHEIPGLPWPLELERHRWQFSKSTKNRTSDHWFTAQKTLLDRDTPGVFPAAQFGADPTASAAAEIETVVYTYLGIQPRWRERTITFDARLPTDWGRTQARIPFADGELYVDYDFANNQAWIAANGLSHVYTCQVYIPTPTGAISGQFKLEPGESPHKISLTIDPGNKYRLRFESDDLPE